MKQLCIHGLNCAIPMIGFGFMDNLVMIQAGDAIDNTIGVAMCLSTLTAAALGQVVSDASGVCFGGFIDAMAGRLGLPMSTLTLQQRNTRFVRFLSVFSSMSGVILGCLLGMTCLFFMDTDKADREKKKKKLAVLFDSLMQDGHTLLDAERCTLWLLPRTMPSEDDVARHRPLNVSLRRTESRRDLIFMWSKSRKRSQTHSADQMEYMFRQCDTKNNGFVNIKKILEVVNDMGWGLRLKDLIELIESSNIELDSKGNMNIAGFKKMIDDIILGEETLYPAQPGSMKYEVIKKKCLVNVPDLYSDRTYQGKAVQRTMDGLMGSFTLSVLIAPVLNSKGEILGVIEATNKESEGLGYSAFTEEDEKLITLLCGQAGRYIEAVFDD
jgi:GAF domain-containing protein